MNKKLLMGFIAAFVVSEILMYIVNVVILGPTYAMIHVWRTDMQSKVWIYHLINLIGSFFFAFIFSEGREGKGVMEGVRYGLYIGIWLSVGMAYGSYAMIDIPYSLALQWFIYGVIQYVITGAVVAYVFDMGSKPAS
ncbi:MAG TPA: hypothetical protein VMM57_04610 [Bacteroidota bacterium]|nr:hypothetical protein [Bacteroidota bacterium]